MARLIELTPVRTYATAKNAQAAVEKKVPPEIGTHLTYFIARQESSGRYFPVFVGERALQACMHFHFNVVA